MWLWGFFGCLRLRGWEQELSKVTESVIVFVWVWQLRPEVWSVSGVPGALAQNSSLRLPEFDCLGLLGCAKGFRVQMETASKSNRLGSTS